MRSGAGGAGGAVVLAVVVRAGASPAWAVAGLGGAGWRGFGLGGAGLGGAGWRGFGLGGAGW